MLKSLHLILLTSDHVMHHGPSYRTVELTDHLLIDFVQTSYEMDIGQCTAEVTILPAKKKLLPGYLCTVMLHCARIPNEVIMLSIIIVPRPIVVVRSYLVYKLLVSAHN